MESVYSSKWILEFIDKSNNENIDLINRMLTQIQRALGVRDDNKDQMLTLAKKIRRQLTQVSENITDLEAEVKLSMKLFLIDRPEPKNRYFTFDEAGEPHQVSKEEYDKVAPPEAIDEEADVTF